MVRTVHMNIFYKINLQNTDQKKEFLMKTERKFRVQKKMKNNTQGPKSNF